MLPTSWGSPADSPQPPFRSDIHSILRGGIVLRGLMAVLLAWVAVQFPAVTWDRAWMLAGMLLGVDGVIACGIRRWPHHLGVVIRGILVADGVCGWGIAWAYSQSPQTLVPVLMVLFLHELLIFYPTRRGAWLAAGYVGVTNGLLGFLPGVHTVPIWPWSVVAYWTAVDGLILGALLVPVHLPLRARALAQLTARQREIYNLTAAGWSTTDIATHLHIDAATVRSHVAHIHRKLGSRP